MSSALPSLSRMKHMPESRALDPDAALMLRVRHDEPGAFAELAERHRPRLFARFFRSFQDRQEAEDLTQDVLLRLYRSRKRYEPRAKFATWLFHIAQNVARNAYRHRRRRACVHLASVDSAEQANADRRAPGLSCPSRSLEFSELAGAIRNAVSGLGNRQRAALEMHQFQNCSYAQIAAALALSTKATKSLLYRARIQLKGFLCQMQVM